MRTAHYSRFSDNCVVVLVGTFDDYHRAYHKSYRQQYQSHYRDYQYRVVLLYGREHNEYVVQLVRLECDVRAVRADVSAEFYKRAVNDDAYFEIAVVP